MMKFVRRQEVEINEKTLAEDLEANLYDVLCYQDADFAEDISDSDLDDVRRLVMLNAVAEIWHKRFLKAGLGGDGFIFKEEI